MKNEAAEAQLASLPLLNQLIELTTYRDIEQWLSKALSGAMYVLDAQAGSLIIVVDKPRLHRQGMISKKVWKRLAAWEHSINQSLNKSPYYIKNVDTKILSKTMLEDDTLMVSAPLLSDKQVVGALSLLFDTPEKFGLVQSELMLLLVRWLGAFGDTLSQKITTRARLKQLDLLNELARQTATLNLPQIIKSTITMATNALNATAASVLLINEPTISALEDIVALEKDDEPRKTHLVFEVVYGEKEGQLTKKRMEINKGIAGWVASHSEPYLTNDAGADTVFNPAIDQNTGFTTKSVLAVPLQLGGRTLGVLEVLNKQSAEGFTTHDQNLLQTIAGQVALAIDNVRLYRAVQREKEHILQTEETIKEELARNLHDGPIQLLSSISWGLDILLKELPPDADDARQEIANLKRLTHQANREARLQMFALHPLILEERGLPAAFEYYWEQMQRDEPNFQLIDETDDKRLEPGTEQLIFSIGCEAMNNALKYAKADNLTVRLQDTSTKYTLTIADDGAGFDLPRVRARYAERNSLGLINMQERAARLGGTLNIETQPGRGTTIVLHVPKTAQA